MADNQKQVTVKIVGDTSGLNKSTNEAQGILSKFAARANIGVAAIAAGFTAIGVKAVAAFMEAEDAQKRTLALLKATGSAAGVTAKDISDLSGELQKASRFGDEAITGVQNTLLRFGNIKSDIFAPTTQAILDMSEAMGTDLQSSANLVGKALEDPLKGLTLLGRSGVKFTEEQQNMITAALQNNDVLAAQTIILDQLNGKFGGTAAAMAGGTGVFLQIKEVIGDLFEQVGMVIFRVIEPAVKGIYKFVKALKDNGTAASITYEIMSAAKAVFQIFSNAVGLVWSALVKLHNILMSSINPYSALIALVKKGTSGFSSQVGIIDELKAKFASTIAFMIEYSYKAVAAFYAMKTGILELNASLAGLFSDDQKAQMKALADEARKTGESFYQLAEDVKIAGAESAAALRAEKGKATDETLKDGSTLFGEQTGRLNFGGEDAAVGGATGKQKFEGDWEIADADGLDALQRAGLAPLNDEQREALRQKLEAQRAEDLSDKEKYQLKVLQNEEAFNKEMDKTALGFLAKRFRNEEASNQDVLDATKDFQSNTLAATKLFGKKGVAVAKAIGIADAIMNTYVAANKALAAFPPPFSYVAAAAAVAAGLANVRQISSQGYDGAANGAIVGGIDNGRDNRLMAVRSGEMIVPSQYVQPLMPALADIVRGEDRNGVIGSNGGGGSQEIVISFKGDAEQFINAQLIKGRVSGVI